MAMRGMLVALAMWLLGAGAAVWVWFPALAGDGSSCPGDAPPACERAREALADAETAIQAAAAKGALWTTAEDAIHEARTAFAAGEYERAARAAGVAAEQAQLGIEQTRYPMLQFPRL